MEDNRQKKPEMVVEKYFGFLIPWWTVSIVGGDQTIPTPSIVVY
jgi:hypothetical protein